MKIKWLCPHCQSDRSALIVETLTDRYFAWRCTTCQKLVDPSSLRPLFVAFGPPMSF